MHEADKSQNVGHKEAAKAALAELSLLSTDRVSPLHGMLVPLGCGSDTWPVHETMQGAHVA